MNILITGGATGLGKAITNLLASDSTNTIYITYRNSSVEASALEANYANVQSIHCDFANPDSIKSLVDRISEIDIDALINNAYGGAYLQTHFTKTEPADYLQSFRENVISVLAITKAAITVFRKKKSGRIVTVLTSALSGTPSIGSSIYVANKAYLQMMMKVWATENAKFNIASNAVSPSFMLTTLTSSIDERVVEQIVSSQEVKKLLTPEEVAAVIQQLLKEPTTVSGVNMEVNPGREIK